VSGTRSTRRLVEREPISSQRAQPDLWNYYTRGSTGHDQQHWLIMSNWSKHLQRRSWALFL